MGLPDTFVPGFHDENEVRKMQYSYLGNTGLKISKLSLGTGGFSYFYGEYDIEECKQLVHEAIKRGVNFIDTAPWYGHGVSEEVLGQCLVGIPRKAYYLATKVCRYEKDPKLMFDFSAEKTKQSIDASLKRLGLEYVDVIQVHDIEFAPTLQVVLTQTLPTLEEIVKSGKAKFIGITGYPVSTLAECVEKSHVKIDTVLSYCRFTMIDDTLRSFIPGFKVKKLGIINGAVNSMGLLTNVGPPEWHPASQHIKDVCSEVREYCKEKDVELAKLAIYYSSQQEGPATTLIGMNNKTLLEKNLRAMNGLTDKEFEVYQEVQKMFGKLKETHWENVELENYWKIMKGEGSAAGFF